MKGAIRYFSVTIGLSLAWALSLWTNSYQEFSQADTSSYVLHLAAAFFVQFAVFAAFYSVAKKNLLPFFVAFAVNAVFCVFNIHTLMLVHFERFETLPQAVTWAILAALLVAFYALFAMLRNSATVLAIVRIFIVLFIVQIGAAYFWQQHKNQERAMEFAKIPDHFTFPEFKIKPNVYIIGFDAMISESMARKFLDIDSLPYVDVMRQEGFRILRNVFAERVPTKPSFNSIAALDMAYSDSLGSPGKHMFETGEIPAPLYELFRRNGYKVQFIYKTSYFGEKDKAGIDYYDFAVERGICSHVDKPYAILGYCLPVLSAWRDRISGKVVPKYPQFLFDRIKKTAKSGERWLTIAHIYYPAHTPLDYDPFDPAKVKDYREKFKASKAPRAATYMRELVKTIRENDPGAVLFVFGDHGLWISRGLTTKDVVVPGSPLTKEEIFLDRHAIALAVYPKEFCAEGFEEPYVNIRMGRTLAKCLSGGQDVLPADYQPVDKYREYIYE